MLVRLEDGREKDVAITEVTPQNYIVPDNERGIWHAVIEVRQFDAQTGKRLSQPRVQKFDDNAWRMCREQLRLQGYTVTILHDPTQYLAKVAERKKVSAAQRFAMQKAAQQAAIDKAVQEALAKQAQQQQAAIDAAVATALAKARKKKAPAKPSTPTTK